MIQSVDYFSRFNFPYSYSVIIRTAHYHNFIHDNPNHGYNCWLTAPAELLKKSTEQLLQELGIPEYRCQELEFLKELYTNVQSNFGDFRTHESEVELKRYLQNDCKVDRNMMRNKQKYLLLFSRNTGIGHIVGLKAEKWYNQHQRK